MIGSEDNDGGRYFDPAVHVTRDPPRIHVSGMGRNDPHHPFPGRHDRNKAFKFRPQFSSVTGIKLSRNRRLANHTLSRFASWEKR
jgi:hypothetical protein